MQSPRDHSLFFQGFLRSSCQSISSYGTGVQLVVFYTTIEAQVVFEMLLTLVTGQLAIAGQLRREAHYCSNHLLQRQIITQVVNLLSQILSEKFTRELDKEFLLN